MITLSISKDCYTSKPTSARISQMTFHEQDFYSVQDFLDKVTKGYTCCNIFNHKGNNLTTAEKSKENFIQAQVIHIDIDKTRFKTISDYISVLKYKPSCAYPSYSDKANKGGDISRRFHLCYLFEEPLDKEQFTAISKFLAKQAQDDTNEEADTCSTSLVQYFNGCFDCKQEDIINNDKTYYINDFKDLESGQKIINHKHMVGESYTTNNTHMFRDDKKMTAILSTECKTLLNDIFRLSYEELEHEYKYRFHYFYRVEKDEWIDNLYQFVDDDYFALYFNRYKLTDGQHRRKVLFERMCLRRIINPNVDDATILWNVYLDVCRFVDNSDHVINQKWIEREIIACFSKSVDELKVLLSEQLKCLRSKNKPSKIILKLGALRNIDNVAARKKFIRYAVLDEYYNEDMDASSNMEYINSITNFNFSIASIYRYCKERGIDTKKSAKASDEQVMNLYDWNKSINKNLADLKDMGIKISKGKLVVMVQKYK